eukprot:2155659-Pleurochrysis_carterae.AAC.1
MCRQSASSPLSTRRRRSDAARRQTRPCRPFTLSLRPPTRKASAQLRRLRARVARQKESTRPADIDETFSLKLPASAKTAHKRLARDAIITCTIAHKVRPSSKFSPPRTGHASRTRRIRVDIVRHGAIRVRVRVRLHAAGRDERGRCLCVRPADGSEYLCVWAKEQASSGEIGAIRRADTLRGGNAQQCRMNQMETGRGKWGHTAVIEGETEQRGGEGTAEHFPAGPRLSY